MTIAASIQSWAPQTSDRFFVAAVVCYALAMLAYAAEWARSTRTAPASVGTVEPERVLVGAGGPPAEPAAPTPPPAETTSEARPGTRPDTGPDSGPSRWSADRFGHIGVTLTVIAVIFHAASLATRGLADGSPPWSNMYGFASAGAFAVAVSYLVLLTRQNVRWLGLLVTFAVVVTMGLAGTVLYADAGPLQTQLRSYWLSIHVTAAIISSGVFTVGSSTAILYLLRCRYDDRVAAGRDPGFARLARRLPPAASLDRTAYRVIAFAFPLWTFAVIAGAIWAEAAWGRYWGWDPKETWAFITWVIYACYLHARSTAGWGGRRAAWIAVVGFVAFLFNFFGVNIFITGLHSYAGI